MTPSKIAEQEKRSEELIKGLNTQTENAPGGTDPATPDAPQQGQDQPDNQDTQDSQEPVQQPQKDGYREKYLTLQGKYNAEIPRLQQTIQDMSQKLRELELMPREEEQQPQQDVSSFNLDEIGEYGDDFKKMGEMLLSIQKENSQLKEHLSKLGQTVEQSQSQTAHNSYLDKVSAHLSKQGQDLQTLNSDSSLLTWLKQSDGMSGQTRHDSLRKAQSAQDVKMTTKIFDAFLKETSISKQKQQAPTPNLQPPQGNTGNDVNPQGTTTGQMWTRGDIKRFYSDKAAGKFVGDDGRKRAATIEADIFAAQRDGRISH